VIATGASCNPVARCARASGTVLRCTALRWRGSGGAELRRVARAQVGSQFVQQFYTVLHSSPKYLHRFYTEESTLTHADAGHDGGDPVEFTVFSQKVGPG